MKPRASSPPPSPPPTMQGAGGLAADRRVFSAFFQNAGTPLFEMGSFPRAESMGEPELPDIATPPEGNGREGCRDQAPRPSRSAIGFGLRGQALPRLSCARRKTPRSRWTAGWFVHRNQGGGPWRAVRRLWRFILRFCLVATRHRFIAPGAISIFCSRGGFFFFLGPVVGTY